MAQATSQQTEALLSLRRELSAVDPQAWSAMMRYGDEVRTMFAVLALGWLLPGVLLFWPLWGVKKVLDAGRVSARIPGWRGLRQQLASLDPLALRRAADDDPRLAALLEFGEAQRLALEVVVAVTCIGYATAGLVAFFLLMF